MAKATIATGIDKGDPFQGFKKNGITKVLDQYAKKAKDQFARHGKEYTGGINEQIDNEGPESRLIGTDDKRVLWTSDGTKDHYVAPRSGGVLAFSQNYVNKTTVNTIPSIPGGPLGNTVFSAGHMVSGIEAGKLDEAIGNLLEDDFAAAIRAASGI